MGRLSRAVTERLMDKSWTAWRSGIDVNAVANCGGVAFFGDSITHVARWELMFADVPVRNFGISGERSAHLLQRLEPLIRVHPEQVFLLIGTNDLASGIAVEDICANVGEILDRLAVALPACELHLQALMPRAKKYAPKVKALNLAYAALAAARGVTFIDLFPLFDDGSGEIAADYTYDRLHLTGAGYAVWRDALRPYIEGRSRGDRSLRA